MSATTPSTASPVAGSSSPLPPPGISGRRPIRPEAGNDPMAPPSAARAYSGGSDGIPSSFRSLGRAAIT